MNVLRTLCTTGGVIIARVRPLEELRLFEWRLTASLDSEIGFATDARYFPYVEIEGMSKSGIAANHAKTQTWTFSNGRTVTKRSLAFFTKGASDFNQSNEAGYDGVFRNSIEHELSVGSEEVLHYDRRIGTYGVERDKPKENSKKVRHRVE